MKLATNPSAGAASSSAAAPSWRIRPSTITPTRSASAAASSKSCVTSSVGSRSSREELGELAADDPARVGVERRERLVEQQHRRVARERPRQRDPLALAAGEIAGTGGGEVRDPEALEQLVHPRAAAEGDVAADVEVREERVLLEDEPDGPPLGRQVDAGVAVEPGGRSERDLPPLRPQQPCDRAQHARLPRSRRSHERERLPPELEL